MPSFKKTIITFPFAILVFFISLQQVSAQTNRYEIGKQLEIYNAIIKEAEMFYVDSVEIEKIVRKGINATLSSLDPYTEYYPEENAEDLRMLTTGEYGGMGAYIREREKGGGALISEPFEGMPAALAGLKAGDYIMSIDSLDVSTLSSSEVSDALKGSPNTTMTLKVKRIGEEEPLTFNITRKKIAVDQVTWYGTLQNSTGYIRLESFTDKSSQEVKEALLDLKQNNNITSLILDLRNNGGGLLDGAIEILGMFLPKGTEVLYTKGKTKQSDHSYKTKSDPIDTNLPLAILINGNSASASEIVAGTLQDEDRAILIGQKSFGKGLVQSTRNLPYDGKLKITISKYYIPSGRCIQRMDYSHRNEDGSVAAIPDSLTKVFYTKNKRPVRDGGGIRPDFEMEEKKTPTMMYYLMSDFVLFDYITQWTLDKPEIAPIESFSVTDEDFEALKQFAKQRNFSYDRQSEKTLKQLKEVAEFEGYLDGDTTIFHALEQQLMPDIERDFNRNKDAIKKMLATEIVRRYYYQAGALRQNLKGDKTLEEALTILQDKELYSKTLTTPAEK